MTKILEKLLSFGVFGLLMAVLSICPAYFFSSSFVGAAENADSTSTTVSQQVKYSEFPHNKKAHQLECSKCHTFPSANWNKIRSLDKAFPDITEFPSHESCLSCHKQQFFRGAQPKICSICHVSSFPPRNSARLPFPNPRELFDLSKKGKTAQSDFVTGFPHDKHIDIVSKSHDRSGLFIKTSSPFLSKRRVGEESCGVCHQTYKPIGDSKDEFVTPVPLNQKDGFWLKKGTFKTSPIGHSVCFACHSTEAGILPIPSNCAACHQLKAVQPQSDFDNKTASMMGITDKVILDTWRLRRSAGKFQHTFFAHSDLSCSTCHNVMAMNTTDLVTVKVKISTCSQCHVTPTSDDGGAVNFEVDKRTADPKFQCTKCHITFGKFAIPKSHLDAITAAKGK